MASRAEWSATMATTVGWILTGSICAMNGKAPLLLPSALLCRIPVGGENHDTTV